MSKVNVYAFAQPREKRGSTGLGLTSSLSSCLGLRREGDPQGGRNAWNGCATLFGVQTQIYVTVLIKMGLNIEE